MCKLSKKLELLPSRDSVSRFFLNALNTATLEENFPKTTAPKTDLVKFNDPSASTSHMNYYYLLFIPILSLVWGCSTSNPGGPESIPPRFSALDAATTGIDFTNELTNTPEFNILNYPYFYNGGGVAVGDFNRDGLPDLFFTANQLPNRLYFNQGELKFEDVTEQAGVSGNGDWATGVSVVDVNADGWLDIYVSYVVGMADLTGHNELFLNQQDGTFREVSAEWGLALRGFGTQASFFDYDRDGDLDLFQLNHSIKPNETIGPASQRNVVDTLAGDRLLRNEGDHFVDVTQQSGIYSSRIGYGLNILTGDINQDGWPDLYVCNDFHEDDYLYLNQGDGTFRESLRDWVGHTSKFSMGGDLADYNNDGYPDLFTLDMKPDVEAIRKTAQAPESYDRYQYKLGFGYFYQYAHNALQQNRAGEGFSEIAQMAGVDATDWSWSALFSDLDNDGRKDLLITNGIYRRPDDMDYISFISEPAVVRQLNDEASEADLAFISRMPSIAQPNHLFQNVGDSAFRPVAESWGLSEKGFTNGAAYADLDRDGDLDLILNNLNDQASIFQNLTREQDSVHFLQVQLKGTPENPFAIGTQLTAWTGATQQTVENFPVRGFESCMEPGFVHFGLGENSIVDSIQIRWPDGKGQTLYRIAADTMLVIRYDNPTEIPAPNYQRHELFASISPNINWTHQENDFVDFSRETLLPHRLSTQGPKPASGDVNRDGLTDLYFPGPRGQAGRLLMQRPDGSWKAQSLRLWTEFTESEEVSATFLDVDGDQDLDLYVACGGNEFYHHDTKLQDRLFLNENGRFSLADSALPNMLINTGTVRHGDFDGDGDEDLFVGGRNVTSTYGVPPRSYLLENVGGQYIDVADSLAPGLGTVGMVTDAQWLDYDADGLLDLAVIGEWMSLELWHNEGSSFQRDTASMPLHSSGWWNCLEAADLDGDGDLDLVAGNLGLNSTLKATPQTPCELYVSDFDANGYSEAILCRYYEGRSYPFASRDELLKQIVSLRRRFPNYQIYAEATINDIFTPQQLMSSLRLEAETFSHAWFEQTPEGFIRHDLPYSTQDAPVFAISTKDLNQDGHADLILGGNFYGVGPNRGRYDASLGHVLIWDASLQWDPVPGWDAGIPLTGEVRDFDWISSGGKQMLVVARNGSKPLFFLPTLSNL